MNENTPEQDNSSAPIFVLTCSVCNQDFRFQVQNPAPIHRLVPQERAGQRRIAEQGIEYYTETCHNWRAKIEQRCETAYTIKYNHNTDKVEEFYQSPTPELDNLWVGIGRDLIKNSLDLLDKRAEYMITTITALIVIDFGLLLGFQVPSGTWKLAPQFLLAVSMVFFFLSLSIKKYEIKPQSPENIQNSYKDIGDKKYLYHNIGYGIFIAALFAIALTYLWDPPFDTIQKVPPDPIKIQLSGSVAVTP
jgi:hypothetical protein